MIFFNGYDFRSMVDRNEMLQRHDFVHTNGKANEKVEMTNVSFQQPRSKRILVASLVKAVE